MWFISDAAKLENPQDLTVYTALESAAILTVKFHMNPVTNYTVYWYKGGSSLDDTNIRDKVKGKHIQTSYFVTYVKNKHLGNYTVQVINWAIASEHNEVTFNVILKLRGKKKLHHFFTLNFCQSYFIWNILQNP